MHFLVHGRHRVFLVVHVALTLLVPRTLLAMVAGRATRATPFRHIGGRAMTLARRRGRCAAGLSLGALTLLTGCDLSDNDAVQRVLAAFSALERQGAGGAVQSARGWRRPFPKRWR